MSVYLISFLGSISIAYLYRCADGRRKSLAHKKIEILIIAFALWFVMAFRSTSVGSDTENYSNIFYNIATSKAFWTHMMFKRAPVYTIYNYLIGIISTNKQWVVICNSFIIVSSMSYVFYKESDNVIGSWYAFVTLNYYFFGMNASRQAMSIALTMVAYTLTKNKKVKQAIAVCICAILIHSAAVVGLILLPLMLAKKKKKMYGGFLIISFVLVSFFDQIMIMFTRIFPEYNMYLNSTFVRSLGNSSGNRTLTAVYILIVILISVYLYKKKKIENREEYFQLLYLLTIAVIPMVVLRTSNISYRVEMYFAEYITLFIPYVFGRIRNRRTRHMVEIPGYAVLMIPYLLKMPEFLPYAFCF